MSHPLSAIYPLWRIARAGCLLLAALLLVGVVAFSPSTTSVIRDGMHAAGIAPRLSNHDLETYAAAFDAVEDGAHNAVGDLFTELHNPLLKGHVLASQYLSSDYTSTREELTNWLQHYGDHPQAPRIASLAARKGVAANAASYKKKALKGRGYAMHLGRSTAPRAWYQGLKAWRNKQYKTAHARFVSVANNNDVRDWHKAAGHYWAARAAIQLDNGHAADEHIEQAANFPDTLYGALAQHQQNDYDYMYVDVPDASRSLYESAAVMRARALASLGKQALAEKELRQLTMALDADERPAMIRLAAEMGLPNLQMRLQSLKGLSADEKRMAAYPMPSRIVNAVHEIDPAIVLSVAKHESAFHANAGSELGATGMMQLMPATAKGLLNAKSFQTVLASNDLVALSTNPINDPMLNIRLGAHYLKQLRSLPRIGDSLIHVLAAYNAGPGNVYSWHKRAKHVTDPLLYMESIPFPETRNYVLQTIHHQAVYQQLLGEDATTFDALVDGQFPAFDSAF